MIRIVKMAVYLTVAIIVGLVTKSAIAYKLDNLKEARVSASPITAQVRQSQLDCLARNIYHEAGYEPFEGKVAVAQVTLNRVDDGRFGKGVCGVVYQKNIIYEKVICQFSWVCESTHKIKPVYAAMYKESEEVAKKVLLENFRLPSLSNAMYYHATYVQPGWRKQKITQIGQHIFYKD